jgi:hypothetical protein
MCGRRKALGLRPAERTDGGGKGRGAVEPASYRIFHRDVLERAGHDVAALPVLTRSPSPVPGVRGVPAAVKVVLESISPDDMLLCSSGCRQNGHCTVRCWCLLRPGRTVGEWWNRCRQLLRARHPAAGDAAGLLHHGWPTLICIGLTGVHMNVRPVLVSFADDVVGVSVSG